MKEFYFSNEKHFINYIKKRNCNFKDEDMNNLIKVCNKALQGDTVCQEIIHVFSYQLNFNGDTTKVLEVAKMIESESFKKFVREKRFFKYNPKTAIEIFLKHEVFEYSEEFLNVLDYLKNVQGLYFLYDENKELIYIGKSRDLGTRIFTSTKERLGSYLKYKITQSMADTHILELYFINKFNPRLNSDSNERDGINFVIDYIFEEESDFIGIKEESYAIYNNNK